MAVIASEIRVNVKYLNLAREKAGRSDETVTLTRETTVAGFLEKLKATHSPDFDEYFFNPDGTVRSYTRIVGGKDSRQLALNRILDDGETIYIFVAHSGG